jgi:hypothetical protein
MRNPRISGLENAKLSTAFEVIHRFILLFAWDMPEIGFVSHRCAIDPHLRAGCTLQLGSGNLTGPVSTPGRACIPDQSVQGRAKVLSVRLGTPAGRHPKTFGFDVDEGRSTNLDQNLLGITNLVSDPTGDQ